MALAILFKEGRGLPTPPFDAEGVTGEGEISADVPISLNGDISFTEKRPGKIRDTMQVNATPNRLNAAETQGPDEEDLKYQTPLRRIEPPEPYEILVVDHSQPGEELDFEAQGGMPRVGQGDESVASYYSVSDIDLMEKSTERQLMTDMSGLDVFRNQL